MQDTKKQPANTRLLWLSSHKKKGFLCGVNVDAMEFIREHPHEDCTLIRLLSGERILVEEGTDEIYFRLQNAGLLHSVRRKSAAEKAEEDSQT